jgi:hypothetical protein
MTTHESGKWHGLEDARAGRCLKVMQMLQPETPDDNYSRGYRAGVAEFIREVYAAKAAQS